MAGGVEPGGFIFGRKTGLGAPGLGGGGGAFSAAGEAGAGRCVLFF